jgi:integrin beta 3
VAGPSGPPGEKGLDGSHGRDGKDGRDAVLKGAIALKQLDERRFAWCWDDGSPIEVIRTDGTRSKDGTIYIPALIYRRAYEKGRAYAAGDVITRKGALWVALEDTSSEPPAAAWQLCVRSGADGKDGPRGPEGPKGRDGRDLTQLGFDGGKH